MGKCTQLRLRYSFCLTFSSKLVSFFLIFFIVFVVVVSFVVSFGLFLLSHSLCLNVLFANILSVFTFT